MEVERLESSYRAAAPVAPGSFRTAQPPDILLSAFGFNRSGGPLQFRYNSGIATDGQRLLVADRGNHRVLIWNELPESNRPPDVVLGQPDFDSNQSGAGLHEMNWPLSVATDGTRVVVADAYNERLLIWNQFPTESGTPADFAIRIQWPWGVWTDGEKLVATATQGSAALVWNRFPVRGDQPADLRLTAGGQFGTPRTITSDGRALIIGDHNAKVSRLGQGNFVWKSFPAEGDPPPDYFFSDPNDEGVAWLQGKFLPDGRLTMLGGMLHFWHGLPESPQQRPALSISGFPWLGGDASDVAVAGGRIFVSAANSNRILVYNTIPDSANTVPDFAIGSPDICTNTLEANYFITNPVPLTNGRNLFVSSDFDRRLSVWRNLPDEDNAKPDLVYRLNFAPWQGALHENTLILAGMRTIAVWRELPLDGQMPSLFLNNQVGRVRFQEIRGVAYDGRYLYISDAQANRVYVWEGIPEPTSDPKYEIAFERPGRLSSDGTTLLVAPAEGPQIAAYRVDDLTAAPRRLGGGAARFNLPGHALVAEGRLFVADTVFNRVHVWNDIEAAFRGAPADALLGSQDMKPSTRREGLFWPGAAAFDGSYLWVGEFKFSGRIARFSPATAESAGPSDPE